MNRSKLDLHDTKYARFIIICIKYFIKLCKPYSTRSHQGRKHNAKKIVNHQPSVLYLVGTLARGLLTRMNKVGTENSFPSMDTSTATFNVR